MTTLARTQTSKSSHFYGRDGSPQYEVIGKTTGRPRPVTIRDARENGWVPSTTTILRTLHKPQLVDWLCEQAALAVLTTPRRDGEELDAFVHRVLHEEKQQDQEAATARDLGTRIHEAIECALTEKPFHPDLVPFVAPAVAEILASGRVVATEKIVVGDRYAGKMDALTQANGVIQIWDFKTTRTLPKYGSYTEAKLQLSSYAKALGNTADIEIRTANLYLSTTTPGQIVVDTHLDWPETYEYGFKPLVDFFYWLNDLELTTQAASV